MTRTTKLFAGAVMLACLTALGVMVLPPVDQACAADTTSFAEDVFPIFKGRCVGCHAPGQEGFEKSGLDLTSYEGVMKGTKFGPMMFTEDAHSSTLVWLL